MNMRGRWYRSEVKLDGDMIVPVPPFESYNPFDWYYPASEVRQGDKSLYLEFLAVNSDNPEEVVRFCERFGVLGSSKVLLNSNLSELAPTLIKALKGASAQVQSDMRERYYQRVGNPNLQDFQPQQLCPPMLISDFEKIRSDFVNGLHFPEDPSPSSATLEKEKVANFINDGIRASRVHSCMNWNVQTRQYETSYSSLDLAGVFYQMVQLDLLGKGKILPCPRCGKPFVTGSKRVRFCSFSCYNVYKVQEHLRKKKALAAQKRSEKAATSQSRKK